MKDDSVTRGLELRKKMFGAESVDQAVGGASDFTKPLQDYVTKECFGDTWHRGTLDNRTRSMLTIAMLVALGQQNQLKNHFRGAIANGVSKDELREILRHAIIYCGLPRSVEAWNTAVGVLKELGLE
jgi:4-carboxymuconolactone decarboxylase